VSTVARYAVIPTHNRPIELTRLVAQLRHDVDVIIIVDNASDPPVDVASVVTDDAKVVRAQIIHVVRVDEQPPNLYRLWNVGVDVVNERVETARHKQWDVAIFNDDAIIPDGWFDAVAHGLRAHGVVIASTPTIHETQHDRVLTSTDSRNFNMRLCPWAFIMRGEVGLRADEQFHWWYGDNDLEWRARDLGGIALLRGPVIINEHANATTTGALAEQAGRDGETFIAKWGRMP